MPMSRTRVLTSGIAIIVYFGWSSLITNSMLGRSWTWAALGFNCSLGNPKLKPRNNQINAANLRTFFMTYLAVGLFPLTRTLLFVAYGAHR